jgi:hypothetical protein
MSSVAFYVTAHQDDWEFFRGQQAYLDIVASPADTRIVFIYTTAGDGGQEEDSYWANRALGAHRAQACALNRMQEPNNYHLVKKTFTVNGHDILRFEQARVPEDPIKIVSYHMRLPDGVSGNGSAPRKNQSLRNLHQNRKPITSIRLEDDPTEPSTTYASWDDFCSTLGAILKDETAQTSNPHPWVNAADWNDDINPGDHSDHRETTLALQEVYQTNNNQFHRAWFQTYCTGGLPANLYEPEFYYKLAVYEAYASAAGRESAEWQAYGNKNYCRTVLAGQSE